MLGEKYCLRFQSHFSIRLISRKPQHQLFFCNEWLNSNHTISWELTNQAGYNCPEQEVTYKKPWSFNGGLFDISLRVTGATWIFASQEAIIHNLFKIYNLTVCLNYREIIVNMFFFYRGSWANDLIAVSCEEDDVTNILGAYCCNLVKDIPGNEWIMASVVTDIISRYGINSKL